MESTYSSYQVAGIDVHKKMLAVADARDTELNSECRKFGTGASERRHLSVWLKDRGVQEVAMESNAKRIIRRLLSGDCGDTDVNKRER